jgi:hypothetical protein
MHVHVFCNACFFYSHTLNWDSHHVHVCPFIYNNYYFAFTYHLKNGQLAELVSNHMTLFPAIVNDHMTLFSTVVSDHMTFLPTSLWSHDHLSNHSKYMIIFPTIVCDHMTFLIRDYRSPDCMVVGFITSYAISAYHH